MPYPADFKYTKEHEWIKADGGNATIGITHYAQNSLGDIVFVDLPKPGAELTAGKTFGSVESVNAVSDLYAPAAGTVTEVIDDLFAPIPAEYRLNRDLKIPRQMAESEIVDWFRERSRENGENHASFLGAGAYNHYRPVIIDSLISRGEFLTAYTPYQAEISQ